MQNTDRNKLSTFTKFFNECLNISKAQEYNLVLVNTPDEIIYLAALKDDFETEYNAPLHFIVNKENEFILKMYDVKNYTIIDFPSQITGTIFPSIPIKGIPFIADRKSENGCNNAHWRKNFGLKASKNKLPINMPKLKYQASKKIRYIDKLDNIVLIKPENDTNTDFWSIVINYYKRLGHSIIAITNNCYYKRFEIITTEELGLSLQDIIALGNSCRCVITERGIINDILCGKGKNMYCFYSGKNKTEYKSLTKLFDVLESPTEILLQDYRVQSTNLEDKNFERELNQFLHAKKEKISTYEMYAMLFKGNKRKSNYFKFLAERIEIKYGTGEKIYANTGTKAK